MSLPANAVQLLNQVLQGQIPWQYLALPSTPIDFLVNGGRAGNAYPAELAGIVQQPAAVTMHTSTDLWELPIAFKNLIVSSKTDAIAFGNNFANVIAGNDGNDYLDGNGGVDTLIGGRGNDVYVYAPGVSIIEKPNGGIDTVVSILSASIFDLPNVENLSLHEPSRQSFGNTTAVGNAGNNTIIGNAGNNTINGAGGTDRIDLSDGGSDTIEVFTQNLGNTHMTVIGFGNDDSIALPAGTKTQVMAMLVPNQPEATSRVTYITFGDKGGVPSPTHYDIALIGYIGPVSFHTI